MALPERRTLVPYSEPPKSMKCWCGSPTSDRLLRAPKDAPLGVVFRTDTRGKWASR